MDAIHCIEKRRSVRKFLSTPIEWSKIVQVIDAGRLAPSAGNIQDKKFLVALDPEVKEQIAQASTDQTWMAKAAAIIIVCSDTNKAKRFYGVRGEILYSIQNSSASIQNMLIVATSQGLGSCWVSAFDEDMLRRATSIPDEITPHGIVVLGYADEKPVDVIKKPLDKMVYFNNWGNTSKDIAEMTRSYGVYVRQAIEKMKKLFIK